MLNGESLEFDAIDISKALSIDGWMTDKELMWLGLQAKTALVIVEFGCYKGRSTRALADNTDGTVYAVDPQNGEYWNDDYSQMLFYTNNYRIFYDNLKNHIDSRRVRVVKNYSLAFEPLIKPDFIFIDGDHHYANVRADILHALKIAHHKALISGHDYGREDWPGVKLAVDELLPNREVFETIWFQRL